MLRVQRDGKAEDVAFVENRQCAGVYPHVLVKVSHAGAEFVRELYLVEEVRDDRVLRLGFQVLRRDASVANHSINRLGRQTNDHPVIVNAKQQIASRLIEKRTNGLECVGLRPVARTLELDVQVFANGEKRVDS